MNNIIQKIVDFTQKRYMKVLTSGFMSVAAVSIAGSLFNLVKSIPIDAFQTFLTTSGLGNLLSIPISITSDLMGLYVVLAMGYQLAKSFNKNGFSAAIISLGAFMILTPLTATSVSVDPVTGEQVVNTVSNAISLSALGSQGIFLAILVALSATRLYIFLMDHGVKLKMPDSVPPNVTGMFEDMIPGGLVFLLFLALRFGFSLTSFGTAQALIYGVLQEPFMSITGGLFGVIIYMLMVKVFWWFGVHGGMVVNSAMYAVTAAAGAANLSAFAAGTDAPFPDWCYASVICAGVGILALNILMLTAKSTQFKALAKIALPTSCFGITEPIMFGTPMIMNVFLGIPFVLSPVVTLFALKIINGIGLLSMPTGASGNMFIPMPISLALLTADWKGFVWGIVLILLNMILYYPFFKMADKKAVEQEKANSEAN